VSEASNAVKSTLAAVMVAGGIAYSMAPTPPPPPPPPKCEASAEAKATINALTDVLKKSVDGLSQACKK
jgi:hypothetical protein